MNQVTEESFTVGSLRFREEHLPDRNDFDIPTFAEYLAYAAPCGGALAFMKNPSMHLMLGIDKTTLDFQSAYGDRISRMDITNWKEVKKVGWTLSEHFVVVFGDVGSAFDENGSGKIEVYTITQELYMTYSIPKRILFADIYMNSIFILTDDYTIYEVTDVTKDKVLDEKVRTPLIEPPVCMCAGACVARNENSTDLYLADSTGSLLQVGKEDCVPLKIASKGIPYSMSLSPDGTRLAMLYRESGIRIINLNHLKDDRLYPHTGLTVDTQMCWCGNGGVCFTKRSMNSDQEEEDELILLTIEGQEKSWYYDECVELVPEVDGTRIYTKSATVFLAPLHPSLDEIFEIGSVAPGATLMDAYTRFVHNDPRAYEYIQIVRPHMNQAVHSLINAAGLLFQPQDQIELMKAAAFGRAFALTDAEELLLGQHAGTGAPAASTGETNSDSFVTRCNQLRVANALRRPEVGIPATIEQLRLLDLGLMIDRLSNRGHFLLACRMCDYLHISREPVLLNWARKKLKTRLRYDPEKLVAQICAKFSQCPNISYAAVAREAAKDNPDVASMLLDYETDPALQVKTLLSIHEEQKAVQKATESGNLLLIFRCIFKLKPQLDMEWDPTSEEITRFVPVVTSSPRALNLFLAHCRRSGRRELELYKLLQYKLGNKAEAARQMLLCAYECPSIVDRVSELQTAQGLLAGEKQAMWQFAAKKVGEHVELLSRSELLNTSLELFSTDPASQSAISTTRRFPYQPTTVDRPHEPGTVGPNGYLDMPPRDILFELITRHRHDDADAFAKQLGFSNRRYAWVRMQAYACMGDWKRLEQLAGDGRRNPVAMEQFAELCLRHNQPKEAQKYIRMIPNKLVKCEMLFHAYTALGSTEFAEALEAAKQITNFDELNALLMRLTNPKAKLALSTFLTAHGGK